MGIVARGPGAAGSRPAFAAAATCGIVVGPPWIGSPATRRAPRRTSGRASTASASRSPGWATACRRARCEPAGVRVLSVSDPRIPLRPRAEHRRPRRGRGPPAGRRRRRRPRAAGREGPPALRRPRRQRGLGGGRRLRRQRAPRPARSTPRPCCAAPWRPRPWWPAATPTTPRRRSSAARSSCSASEPLRYARLTVHPSLRLVFATPAYGVETARARAVLPASVPRADAVGQASALAGLVLGLERGDGALLRAAMVDRVAEPCRIPLYPGYARAREAALAAGRLRRGGERRRADPPRDRARGRRGRGGPRRRRGVRAGRHLDRACTSPAWTPRERGSSERPRTCAAPPAGRSSRPRAPARTAGAGGCSTSCSAPARAGRPCAGASTGAAATATPPCRAAASGASARSSCPAAGPSSRTPRATPASTAATRSRAASGHDDLALKHEGENPTGSFKDRGMTVAVTQAVRAGATAVACASTGQHLGLDGRLRGAGRAAGARLRPGGEGGGGEAGPGPRLRRADAPREGRLRRVPAPRARGLGGPRDRPAQLDQPLAARGPEDDRVGAAAAARLGAAGLDRAPGRQPRQHLGLREGAARGARAGAHPRASRGWRRCRPRARARSTAASAGASAGATGCEAETVATAIRIGDPASHDRAVRTIRETRGPRHVRHRPGDPRGQGGGRRGRHRLRARLGGGGGRDAPARPRGHDPPLASRWSRS